MNYFKEYDDSEENMSCWLPWACQAGDGVIVNKDDSLIGVFIYAKNEKQEEGKRLQAFLRSLRTGWIWWSERQSTAESSKNYIVLCWNPKKVNNRVINLPKTLLEQECAKQLEVPFQSVLNECALACGGLAKLRQLKGLELLQYLHDTVTPGGGANNKPEIPLYLDALLSQQNHYSVDSQSVQVNEQHIQAIQIFGFMAKETMLSLFAFLEERCAYRFVRRLLCFDDVAARREAARYMKGWCTGRKSILPALDYEYNPEKLCGILTNTLLVWHEDAEKLEHICGEIQETLDSAGELSVIEKYRLSDVWMGTLPGMFRCNLVTPLAELDHAAMLVV